MGTDPGRGRGQQEVLTGAGDVVSARLPTPAEADELGMQRWAGVPVVSVRRSGESAEELYDSRSVRVLVK